MAINQISTANTFEHWLIATQSLIEQYNYYESNTVLIFQTVSDVSNTANQVALDAATVNSQTQIVLTAVANSNVIITNALNTSNVIISNSLNTSNIIINNANNFANNVNITSQNAYVTANLAYSTANAALAAASNTTNAVFAVTNDTTTNATYYPSLFSSTAVSQNTGFISSTKLYYNPSTGQLSATNFDSLSDVNKKKEIETIQNAVSLVSALRGVTFRWKENDYKSMGLIAQEVEEVIPEVVLTNEFGEKSVTYGSLIGLMVEAIKELNVQITDIKNHINNK